MKYLWVLGATMLLSAGCGATVPPQPQPMLANAPEVRSKAPIKVNPADVMPLDPLWQATYVSSPSAHSADELSPEDGIRYMRSLSDAVHKRAS